MIEQICYEDWKTLTKREVITALGTDTSTGSEVYSKLIESGIILRAGELYNV